MSPTRQIGASEMLANQPYRKPHFQGRNDPLGNRNGNCELAQLLHCLSSAKEGRAGVLQVQGAAGVGKSRLLEEFVWWADREDCVVIRTSIRPRYGSAAIERAVADLSEQLLAMHADDQSPDRAMRGGLRAVVEGMFAPVIAHGLARAALCDPIAVPLIVLPPVLKYLANHDTQPAPTAVVPRDLEGLGRVLRTANAGLCSLESKAALVVIVDQWDDLLNCEGVSIEETDNQLQSLDEGLDAETCHVLVVVGVRIDRAPFWWALTPNQGPFSPIVVRPLQHESVRQILLTPDGPGTRQGQFVSSSAADILVANYYDTRDSVTSGDLATLLAIVDDAVQQADQLPLTVETCTALAASSLTAMVERAQRRFIQEHKDEHQKARAFLRALCTEVAQDWTELSSESLAVRLDGVVEPNLVRLWLEWWARRTPLFHGAEGTGYRFRHEQLADAFVKVMASGDPELVAAQRDATTALWLLRRADDESRQHACRLIGDVPVELWQSLPELRTDLHEALKRSMSGSEAVRLAMARASLRMMWQQTRSLLTDLLHSQNWVQREYALEALRFLRCPDAASVIVSLVGTHGISSLLPALQLIGSNVCMPLLVPLLHGSNDQVREVASILGELGDPDAAPALTPLLENPNRSVRHATIQALLSLGTEPEVGTLLEVLSSNWSGDFLWAATALARIIDEEGLQALREMATHPDYCRRLRAVVSLGEARDHGAIELLRKAMVDDPSPDIRVAATRSLAKLGVPEAEAQLVALSTPASGGLREIADRALAGVKRGDGPGGHQTAVGTGQPVSEYELVAALVRDEPPDMRRYAAEELGEQRSLGATEALLSALEGEGVSVRLARAEALARQRGGSLVKPLVGMLYNPQARVRDAAVTALTELGASEALPDVIRQAKREQSLRPGAARFLSRVGDSTHAGLLLGWLRVSPATALRAAVADALGAVGNRGSAPYLAPLMMDPEPTVRIAAARALAALDDRLRFLD